MVDFDEDLEGLFKAAMADPSVTGDVPKKGAVPKRPVGKGEDSKSGAAKPSTSSPSAPAKKQATIPPDASAPRAANTSAPPKSNSPAMRAPTQMAPEGLGSLKPAPSRSLGGGTSTAVPTQPPPSRSLPGNTGVQLPTQPPSRSAPGSSGPSAPAQLRPPPSQSMVPKPAASQSMAPKPLAGAPISRAATQALPQDALPKPPMTGAAVRAHPSSLPTKSTAPQPAAHRPSLPPRKAEQPRTNLKLIDYAPDEPLIDHKGRAKPLYEPRSPRPKTWRPSRPIRVLLGLFPGTRVMAMESFKDGLPYAIFGLLALVPALFLAVGWGRTTSSVRALMIDERWLLAHAGLVLVLILLYEALRLASFFEERSSALRAPRVLAALAIPSAAILWTGPELVALWPQLVESAWFAALVLAVGGLAGAVWSALDGTLSTPAALRNFRVAGAVILAALVATAVLTHAGQGLAGLAGYARSVGFRTLPELLLKLS